MHKVHIENVMFFKALKYVTKGNTSYEKNKVLLLIFMKF
jgi:hypothetical protein